MFASLSDRLSATFRNLRGKGRLSEADIDETVREIRIALLDADVALPERARIVQAVAHHHHAAPIALQRVERGRMNPQQLQAFVNPQGVIARNYVEEVVQSNLRAILGAQFTAQEIEL